MRPGRKLIADRRGAAALEFALIAGPMLLLLLGTIEVGRAQWSRQTLHETAIQGARCMGVLAPECTTSGAYDAAKTKTFVIDTAKGWGLVLEEANVTLQRNVTCEGVAGFSRVALVYEFSSAFPQAIDALPLTTTACFPNQPTL